MNYDRLAPENMPEETGSIRGLPNSSGRGRKIKTTTSICPHCLRPLDAQVFER